MHNLQDGSNEASEVDEEDVRGTTSTVGGESGDATTASAACDEASTEMPMVVDYDGPTDSNSSSSSTTPIGHGACANNSSGKQISKLQAILQQNLSGETAANPNSNGKGKIEADISNVLRGNPNISMRELFHGEEDLGVQFKVPFGCSSSQRTPEGWTRVHTFLQYDEPTRRLWEKLQKPYGNQSSFLRHLILLEKYYRNGDLVLAPHASPNASVYTQTVRQRLNSYDHGHCGGLLQGNVKTNANSSSSSSSPNAQSNADANANSSSSSSSCSPHAQTQVTVSSNAASTFSSGGGGTVLANALTTPHATDQQSSQAEAVIPLVELNDDDDNEDDKIEEDLAYYSPEVALMSLDRLRLRSVDKLTKQLSSNAVTITARPKDSLSKRTATAAGGGSGSGSGGTPIAVLNEEPLHKVSKDAPPLVPTSAANSRSILKANLLNKAVEILPLASHQPQHHHQQQHQSSHKPASASGEKPHKLLDMANKLISHVNNETAASAASVALLSCSNRHTHIYTHTTRSKSL